MKIALVTPFSPDATMGKYAKLILPFLSRRHEVEILCPPSTRIIEAEVPVTTFEPGRALGDPRLDEYDMLVYQMGNDPAYFLPILELAQHRPGLIILHDYMLHSMLAFYYLSVLRQPLTYVRLVERTYGEAAREYAEQMIIGRKAAIWETDQISEYPLFEPILANALGAVVHSDFHLRKLRKAFDGPSTRINLALGPKPKPSGQSRTDLGIPPDRLLMLSTGYIGKSKLHDLTIKALGKSPELASKVIFAIVGEDFSTEGPKLRKLVQRLRLEGTVRFLGFQPESSLHTWIEHADFCVNLRRPTTEGSSLSLLEQMMHGKPVVVLPNGFFREIPPDAVVRADEANLENLHELLLRLANDEAWRARVGANARKFVESGFDAADYAERLADFISEVHTQRPLSLLKQKVSLELARMGQAGEEIAGPWARKEIQKFLEGDDEQPPC